MQTKTDVKNWLDRIEVGGVIKVEGADCRVVSITSEGRLTVELLRSEVVGQVVSIRDYRGYEIHKTVTRIAYARNGNTGNPTVYYSWFVPKGGSSDTLRRARALIDEILG
jgi:hypothetical protein